MLTLFRIIVFISLGNFPNLERLNENPSLKKQIIALNDGSKLLKELISLLDIVNHNTALFIY
jgi:hypothetical protein